MTSPDSRWIRFLRTYGPIPTNDNMYDESIQRAIKRLKVQPVALSAQYLDEILANLRSDNPHSMILTGTPGDGKTYHAREAWLALGGSDKDWNRGSKIQRLQIGRRELVVVKDLSELRADEGEHFIADFAADATSPDPARIYLIAANHGQLLEKLKISQSNEMTRLRRAVEDLLVGGLNNDETLKLVLRDLSQAPASETMGNILDEITEHPGWSECESCSAAEAGNRCPILENRRRLRDAESGPMFRRRLAALIEISELNGVHFPIRQLLALAANILLGHPSATDGLMSCSDVPVIVDGDTVHLASIYRNVFGENLTRRRAEKTELFKKLNSFGIGSETSNKVDNLLVYGADDPQLSPSFSTLVLADAVYGGTPTYLQAQRQYLEGSDPDAREAFLPMLRSQRQRIFFTLPESHEQHFALWDLTVFRYGGLFLEVVSEIGSGRTPPRDVMHLLMRGLNRVFTGMLLQNQDHLVVATSGSHSQSKTSPLLDSMISVPRKQGEEISLLPAPRSGLLLQVRVSRGDDPGAVKLALTPTRFEFLGRVAEGALPSSFSLECHEDLLAFKAKLLSATERRRELDEDGEFNPGELVLQFIELLDDGRATDRRVTVRTAI